jgi:hypothetical protein
VLQPGEGNPRADRAGAAGAAGAAGLAEDWLACGCAVAPVQPAQMMIAVAAPQTAATRTRIRELYARSQLH